MGFIAAKCTQCGANIQVDDSKEAGICSHCKTAFVTEKAINNYSTYVTNNNNYAGATIIGNNELQKLIDAAKGYEKLGDLIQANSMYYRISKEFPQEFDGWWGLVLTNMSRMKEKVSKIELESIKVNFDDKPTYFNEVLANSDERILIENYNYISYAKKLANDEQIKMIDDELKSYTNFMQDYIQNELLKRKQLLQNTYPTFEEFFKDLDDNKVEFSGVEFPNSNSVRIRYEIKLDPKKKIVHLSRIDGNIESRCIVTGWDNNYTLNLGNNVDRYEIKSNKGNWNAWHKDNSDISKSELNKTFTITGIIENRMKLVTNDDRTIILHRSKLTGVGYSGRTYFKGGCYVASSVYGSYNCPQVWTLRRYRDEHLASTWYGRGFILSYYAISPTIVKWFGNDPWFNRVWKARLNKLVSNLQEKGIENTPYEDKIW